MNNDTRITGYPSVDKPWLKYYNDEAINAPLPKMSMYNYLYESNKDYLSYTALNYFGKKTTYKDLLENIDKVAVALQATGIKKGDIISVCSLTSPETVYLLYAINKVGAVSNWLGLTSPVQDLHEQLVSTETKLVFVVEMAYDLIVEAAKDTKVEKIVSIPIEYSMPAPLRTAASLKQKHPKLNEISVKWKDFLLDCEGVFKPVVIDNSEIAMIVYTGGTTGVPKGVMLSNIALNSYPYMFDKAISSGLVSYQKGDKFLCCVPMFLAFGLSACCNGPLCQSMECLLSPDPSPEAVADMIIKYKPQHLVAGSLHYDILLKKIKEKHTDLSFIKSAMYGGETVNKEWEKQVNTSLHLYNMSVPLLNGYGMTETAATSLITTSKYPNGLLPLYCVVAKITDPDDIEKELCYDREGELFISADTIMNGYYKNEKLTDETIVFSNGSKWIRTHDLAKISSDGLITITGRIKRIYSKLTPDNIEVRVYPMRIEEILSNCKSIQTCCVVGVKDPVIKYKTIAYIIPNNTADTNKLEAELDKLCRENLPESHIPNEYRFVSDFPLTRAGKVDYRALEKMEN